MKGCNSGHKSAAWVRYLVGSSSKTLTWSSVGMNSPAGFPGACTLMFHTRRHLLGAMETQQHTASRVNETQRELRAHCTSAMVHTRAADTNRSADAVTRMGFRRHTSMPTTAREPDSPVVGTSASSGANRMSSGWLPRHEQHATASHHTTPQDITSITQGEKRGHGPCTTVPHKHDEASK